MRRAISSILCQSCSGPSDDKWSLYVNQNNRSDIHHHCSTKWYINLCRLLYFQEEKSETTTFLSEISQDWSFYLSWRLIKLKFWEQWCFLCCSCPSGWPQLLRYFWQLFGWREFEVQVSLAHWKSCRGVLGSSAGPSPAALLSAQFLPPTWASHRLQFSK